jgi:transposase
LVVGIDIAKEKHAAQATNFRGIALTKCAVMVDNNRSGFKQLERTIRHLQQVHGMDDVIVGMESTGHYWFNIANWLVEQGIDVVLVNPLTTKRNKENRDNSPSKSDPKDALVIADVVSRGYYTPFTPSDEIFQRLRAIVKNREFWVKESGRFKNQIVRWLDIHFPEYTVVFKKKKVFSIRSLATLRAYPSPRDLQDLKPEQLIEVWQQHMSRPGGVTGMRKASQLIHLAKSSIGDTTGLDEDKRQLQHLLDAYEWVRKMIDEADQEIECILPEVPCAD